ncbi:hypothetical protein ASPVEDRAFT_70749 [Aspergillus versicolor CBS 583.65]|uniref:GDP-mannose transporter n=1 Tax=Aspergillus versicolor CBS 583.65 TaxID=1036611 RepID=A0A1L9PG88_ASPVE|nr:uncharacterized protein ASPVEDRAFT_70749 [Aspergillus versicolor CBS 583.65]OJJ00530.1 hypothetical protein ASPVEDRAFT_70749 [Aspergillus versicolor CBS 583.65]
MIYPPQNSDRRDEETILTTEKDLSVSSISSVDEYDAGLKKPVEDNEEVPLSRNARFLLWTVLNVASTVGIVFTNKSIMSDVSFSNRQVSLACYHFFITGATLWIASFRFFGAFIPKPVSLIQMTPIAAAMAIQVVLQNLSLAHSSVMFHQLARLLLTPVVALLNYVLFRVKIPRAALLPLVLLCTGVGIVTYYDSLPAAENGTTTTAHGVIFALTAVCASSIYTVWIGHYHKRYELSSMQLLLNQAPISACLLLCAIPWAEAGPAVSSAPTPMWSMVLLSGLLACMVNLSQFYIVDAAGAVSGAVIGQLKTCIIVGLGWAWSNHVVPRESVLGIIMALVGMSMYMNIVLKNR